jgi:hypothetical protein
MRKIILGVVLLALMGPLAGCVVYEPHGAYYSPAPVYYRAYPYPYYSYRPYYGYYGYRYRGY